MSFDPDNYSISIRKENIDGEMFYVGRVAEFPNLCAFEDTFDAAREILKDAIVTVKRIADESGEVLPQPFSSYANDYSGRITLRIPKTLHAKIDRLASQEAVSVNQFLNTAIATYVGEINGLEQGTNGAVQVIKDAFLSASKTSGYLLWDQLGEEMTPSETKVLQLNHMTYAKNLSNKKPLLISPELAGVYCHG